MNAFRFLLLAGLLAVLAVPAQAQLCLPPCGEPILKPDGIAGFYNSPHLGGQTRALPERTLESFVATLEEAVALTATTTRAGKMGMAFGLARDGALLTHVVSGDLRLVPGAPGLIRPGHGPVDGVFEAFLDPLEGFFDPLEGFFDPLEGFDNPIIAFDNPIIAFEEPALGFEEPALGFDNPIIALDAIWGNGNVGFEAEYALVAISYPLAGNQARLSGGAVIVPFDFFDGDALAPGNPPEAGALAGEAAVRVTASPNPFRTVSALQYTLSEAAEARLAIYDLLGREVAVLVDEACEAGMHTVRWDAAGLAAGVYVVRLTTGDVVRTQRVTVVR